MVKRLFDVVFAGIALAAAAPLLALAALGIRVMSPGPVFYRSVRVGRHGRLFHMYKLRTMHAHNGASRSAITARNDPRVFPFGRWLRRSKLDELPQLVNVLRGDMSVIGPRPEDPKFVDAHYSRVHFETLDVRPGLASPGSIYNYTHGELLLTGGDPERRYIEQLLPLKLALDVAYVRHASLWYDAALMARTAWVIAGSVLGRRWFSEPREMAEARRLLASPAVKPSSMPERLARALQRHGVRYCQWKSHWKSERWSNGDGDVDLLVDRAVASRVASVLGGLGFKAAAALPGRDVPGATMFYGLDCAHARPLKVHVHYQLVVGDPWRTHYHLPLERAFLESAIPADPLAVPSPELEYLVFVLRAALRHRLRDSLPGRASWRAAIQPELTYLEGRADTHAAWRALADHLPPVTPAVFTACRQSLRPGAPIAARLRTAQRLRRALRNYATRPRIGTLARLALSRVAAASGLQPAFARRSLASGGRVISLVGGDGSGKSTCVRELRDWLERDLAVMTAHLGRPPRSLLTFVVGAALKLRNWIFGPAPEDEDPPTRFPGYLALVRHVCTARDRARLYARIQHFATVGGLAIGERHPIPQNATLAGPVVARYAGLAPRRALAARIAAIEQRYYERIPPPDVLLVLRLAPDEAVRRKPEEPLEYVRRRATVIWQTDWNGTGAVVVDASRPLPAVVANLKRAIWAAL